MKITLPIPEKLSLNVIYAGVHYRVRKEHKDLYRELVWALVRGKHVNHFPVHITYRFQFKGRLLDSSNCAYMVKLFEDGLVHTETLPDDSPKYVAATTMITEKGNDEVEITIEPYGQN